MNEIADFTALSLATGRYPHQNGVMGLAHDYFGWQLHATERPTARLLRQAGYRTALFGLQHVTYDVPSLGFDDVFPERPAEQVADNVIRYLKQPVDSRPVYIEINHQEPHRPFDFGGVVPHTEQGVTIPPWLPPSDEVEAEFALMQGAIRKMDEHVGRILAALPDRDNTLVVFIPDHGLPFPFAKGTLYDPGLEVALLACWPAGGVGGGTVVRGLISNVDVLPTYLEAAQAACPGGIEGHSLLGAWRSGRTSRQSIFAEKTFHEEYDPMRCIRTCEYKLIVNFEVGHRAEVPGDIMAGGTFRAVLPHLLGGHPLLELYHLPDDPLERTNLANDENHAQARVTLLERLSNWMHMSHDPLLLGPIPSPVYHRALQLLFPTPGPAV